MNAIETAGLAKRFGARTAVEGLSFAVSEGEVFGLLGPNGAGKTTTVRMLTGLLVPSEGTAVVCGQPLSAGASLRRAVGLLTEQPGLSDRLTGRENLEFFVRVNELDPAAAWARASRYLSRFGLAGREDEPCGSYSKGMRQKLAIIRALVHDPKVVFLDEPTSGLDPESARAVRDAVAEPATEGRTIVSCSHNLAEVERLCSHRALTEWFGLFLMMPVFVPILISSQAIAGEKERRTLEPLLASPVTAAELMVGKSLASLVPAVGISLIAFVLFCGVVDAVAWPFTQELVLPNGMWLFGVFVIAPLFAFFGNGVAVVISARVAEARLAQQLSGLFVLPLVGLVGGQVAGLLSAGPGYYALQGAVVLLLDLGLVWLGVRLFDRERLISRWT